MALEGPGIALNIKDREAEKFAAEIAAMTGESKTRAVKVALQERRHRPAVSVVTATAVLMLYWRAQVFVCDFREVVFPCMPRRAPWLCG